jgi:hypothetical protein
MNVDVRSALEQPRTAASTRSAKPLPVPFVEPAEGQPMNDAAYTAAACGHLLKHLRYPAGAIQGRCVVSKDAALLGRPEAGPRRGSPCREGPENRSVL